MRKKTENLILPPHTATLPRARHRNPSGRDFHTEHSCARRVLPHAGGSCSPSPTPPPQLTPLRPASSASPTPVREPSRSFPTPWLLRSNWSVWIPPLLDMTHTCYSPAEGSDTASGEGHDWGSTSEVTGPWGASWFQNQIHVRGEGPMGSFVAKIKVNQCPSLVVMLPAYIILWHLDVLQFSKNFT
jgi:hypothetical protein